MVQAKSEFNNEGSGIEMEELNLITEKIIGSAIEVHRHLGPGLLESAYQIALAREMSICGLSFEREKSILLEYKGIKLDCSYRLDFIVENRVIVEIKSIDTLLPIHEAQLLTYLRLSGCKVGLLINFNVRVLKNGLKRMALLGISVLSVSLWLIDQIFHKDAEYTEKK